MLDRLAAIHPLLPTSAALAALVCVALIANFVARPILLGIIRRLVTRTNVAWDDTLYEHRIFERLSHFVPALVVFFGIELVPDLGDNATQVVRNVAVAYLALMLTLAVSALLSAASDIYDRTEIARERPLKGFVQLLQILVWIVGLVMVIAALVDRSPILLLSGFGAMTAILLLVFKDTILSLVASVQLAAQDMVRVGDWIEMPQFGADGDVIDVQLHTIKVQNWDKTISMIPTHRLISDSFKNWRGMSESGGRRIKRAVQFDVSSIRFLEENEVDRFRRFALLADYIEQKTKELSDYNAGLKHETDESVNQRRLTNIGTFRAYAANYLKNHPRIHKNMTLLVRQQNPGADGLPIEIYCFTNTTEWAVYEGIQSDIFDHLIAVVPEFGLRLFQNPTGGDFSALTRGDSD